MAVMEQDEFKMEVIWQNITPALSEEICAFWQREGALPNPDLAARRVKQVLVVCRATDSGDIVGVATAVKMAVPRLLNNVVYYYRHYVAENWRQKQIGTALVRTSRQYLNQRFVSGEDTSAKGLFTVTESPILQKARRQGVSPAGTFMGVNEKGEHLRIAWFDGAKFKD